MNVILALTLIILQHVTTLSCRYVPLDDANTEALWSQEQPTSIERDLGDALLPIIKGNTKAKNLEKLMRLLPDIEQVKTNQNKPTQKRHQAAKKEAPITFILVPHKVTTKSKDKGDRRKNNRDNTQKDVVKIDAVKDEEDVINDLNKSNVEDEGIEKSEISVISTENDNSYSRSAKPELDISGIEESDSSTLINDSVETVSNLRASENKSENSQEEYSLKNASDENEDESDQRTGKQEKSSIESEEVKEEQKLIEDFENNDDLLQMIKNILVSESHEVSSTADESETRTADGSIEEPIANSNEINKIDDEALGGETSEVTDTSSSVEYKQEKPEYPSESNQSEQEKDARKAISEEDYLYLRDSSPRDKKDNRLRQRNLLTDKEIVVVDDGVELKLKDLGKINRNIDRDKHYNLSFVFNR